MPVIGSFARKATWIKDGVVRRRAIMYSIVLARYSTARMEIAKYFFNSIEKSNSARIAGQISLIWLGRSMRPITLPTRLLIPVKS